MKKLKFVKALWLKNFSLVVILFLLSSCWPEDDILPVVQSISVKNITENGATISGVISVSGSAEIIERGVYLNENRKIPVSYSSSSAFFEVTVSDLDPGSNYTVKAYATNIAGTGYGQSLEFKTLDASPDSATMFPHGFFGISGKRPEILNVETDEEGDIYVAGVITTEDNKRDAFVAKFSKNAKLLWRYDVVGPHSERPRGGLIAKDGVLYVHMGRDDEYGTGAGKLYVDAYDCESGKMLWSREVSEGLGNDMVLSNDGFIYSLAHIKLTKLDLAGNIVTQFTAQGSYHFRSISLYDNKLLVGGSSGKGPTIWCFDSNLNLLWDDSGVNIAEWAHVGSIVHFPEKNLVFLTEMTINMQDPVPLESFVVCYEIKDGGGLEFKWNKLFANSVELHMEKDGDNFYLYTADRGNAMANDPRGPVLMNIKGDVLWTANPKISGYIAIFGEKIYIATGENVLTVINI